MRFICFCLIALLTAVTPPGIESRINTSALYKDAAKQAKNGNIDQSIELFKKVIEANPYYTMGHYGLGRAYLYKEGKIKDAIKHLAISVKLDKKNAKGYFYLGLAYMLDHKYTHSINAFANSYHLDKTFVEALYNIGVVYDLMMDEKANKYFDKYIQIKQKEDMDVLF